MTTPDNLANAETLTRLSSAYISLLSIPNDDPVRIRIQPLLASIRDLIAAESGTEPEEVQDTHEQLVRDMLLEELGGGNG
jgi:hypothetical protein